MEDTPRYHSPDGTFSVRLPVEWEAEPDPEEGGIEMWGPAEAGTLHLLAFPDAPEEPADPGEELYVFLHEQGIELEEDEVEDIELTDGSSLAICEYIAEEDDPDEEPTFWLTGVATGPGCLVFAGYSCPAGQEGLEREAVRAILASLHLRDPARSV